MLSLLLKEIRHNPLLWLLSLGLAVLLIVAHGLSMLFSLKTHPELFAGAEHAEAGEAPWPVSLALVTLAVVTVLVALMSEVSWASRWRSEGEQLGADARG